MARRLCLPGDTRMPTRPPAITAVTPVMNREALAKHLGGVLRLGPMV